MRERTPAYTCEAGARIEAFINFLAVSGNNLMMGDGNETTELFKAALNGISFSNWPCSMVCLQLAQRDVITSTYSIIGFGSPHSLYLGISTLLEE